LTYSLKNYRIGLLQFLAYGYGAIFQKLLFYIGSHPAAAYRFMEMRICQNSHFNETIPATDWTAIRKFCVQLLGCSPDSCSKGGF